MNVKVKTALCTLVILSAITKGSAWKWETYEFRDGNCSISIPNLLEGDTLEFTSEEGGTYTLYRYVSSTAADDFLYFAFWNMDYWQDYDVTVSEGQDYLRRFIQDEKERLTKPETIYAKRIVLDDTFPGLEFELSYKSLLFRKLVTCRVYLVGKRIYEMRYHRPKGFWANENSDKYMAQFFDSFQLLEED